MGGGNVKNDQKLVKQAIKALSEYFSEFKDAKPEEIKFAPMTNAVEPPAVCPDQKAFKAVDPKECKAPANCSTIDGNEDRFHSFDNKVRVYKDVTWDQLKEKYPDQIFKGRDGYPISDAAIDSVFEPVSCIEYVDLFEKGTVQYFIAWRLDDEVHTVQEGVACTFKNKETGAVISHEAKGKTYLIEGSLFDRIARSALAYFGCAS